MDAVAAHSTLPGRALALVRTAQACIWMENKHCRPPSVTLLHLQNHSTDAARWMRVSWEVLVVQEGRVGGGGRVFFDPV